MFLQRWCFLFSFILFSSVLGTNSQETVLSRVRIKGILVNKERYRSAYFIQPGEIFDGAQHKAACQQVRELLEQDGYCGARVHDDVVYSEPCSSDSKNRSVTVTLLFENVVSYHVRSTRCVMNSGEIPLTISQELDRMVVGKKYTASLRQQYERVLQERLWEAGYLATACHVSHVFDNKHRTIDLTAHVFNSYSKKMAYEGSTFFSSSHLTRELAQEYLGSLMIVPAIMAEDIQELYQQEGFAHVRVNWREESDRVVFVVQEGARTCIKKVILHGDIFIQYARELKSITDKILGPAHKKKEERLCQEICELYQREGYWDTKVQVHTHVSDGNVQVTITAGAQRVLRSINLADLERYGVGKSFSWPFYKPISPVWLATVQHSFDHDIHRKGFLYAYTIPDIKKLSDGVHIAWQVHGLDKQVRFGDTSIRGSSGIHAHIRDEFAYKKGDVFSYELVDKTLKRLREWDAFEGLSLVPTSYACAEEEKNMVLSYGPESPYELRARFALTRSSKSFTHQYPFVYSCGVSFIGKNLSRYSDQLQIHVDKSRFGHDITGLYFLPHVSCFPGAARIVVTGFSRRYDQPLAEHIHEPLYRASRDGFSCTLRPAQEPIIGEWQLTCGSEWLKISHLSCAHAQVIDFSCAARDNRVPYLVLEPSWSFSTLDSPQDPTRGFFTHILCKGMFSLDKASPWWLKLWGECSFFYPFTSTITGGISVRSGSVFHIPLSELIPTERFYLGGSQTLRGYEFGMVPPLNSFVDDEGRRIWVAVGSKTVVSGSAELRFPLYKYVGAVVFTDIGFLKPLSFAAATGFGVRCATPVGPLRFDIGWKWKKRSTDDRSYAWFITYGQAF